MLQELSEAEASVRIGVEWNEHTDSRTAFRNGHRDKTLSTQAGDLMRSTARRPSRSGRSHRQRPRLSHVPIEW
ncbi:transposase [Streptomyces sp. NPDC005708]|uniref:transposase n=1 Tax=Streptomyces sp. NPDC005708 TaxID=3154564 RepID=UPI0033EEAED1